MFNCHRTRDCGERADYIYLSDLDFFEWSKNYLSHQLFVITRRNLEGLLYEFIGTTHTAAPQISLDLYESRDFLLDVMFN